jgi:hypothetical protein
VSQAYLTHCDIVSLDVTRKGLNSLDRKSIDENEWKELQHGEEINKLYTRVAFCFFPFRPDNASVFSADLSADLKLVGRHARF